ncbi:MAG: protein-methionine-sulfoxide reductase catalytic subunit MsrP [Alphaproteobacteria bacterium]|nr:protein-methionine-sulfoxide reductase catalytic subunit MsrP [Alphaproteobacteria bacterium]
MLTRVKRAWELPERDATPEPVFLDRRRFLLAAAGGALASGGLPAAAIAQWVNPAAVHFPAPRSTRYALDRELTDEATASAYNNFYEFGSHKRIQSAAAKLPLRPWRIAIGGLVEEERTLDIDELFKLMPIEERLYRLRCVEAWSMAVPWTGFPLAKLVALAKPLAEAKYVVFETFKNPDIATGQKQFWYPWPYLEGATMAEATNDLAFLVMGAYGKPLAPQFGAPLRLALPWKYGFKSIKSIVRVSFHAARPVSFWEKIQPQEYGFWANVNPAVSHPRWSQAQERVLGSNNMVPTLLYNGYAEQVAGLYKDLGGEALFR